MPEGLNRCTMSGKEKEKWGKALAVDMISSDESVSGDEDAIATKLLPWRSSLVTSGSSLVTTFFHRLDEKAQVGKSRQAKRQTKKRVRGHIESDRPVPSGYLEWTLADQELVLTI